MKKGLLVSSILAVLAALAFFAVFILRQDLLPESLQSQDYKNQVQKAENRVGALVREAFVVEGGKGIVVILPDRLGLVHIDTATGKAVLKNLPAEVLPASYDVAIPRPEARFALEGSLFWSGDTGELVDLHTARRVKAQLQPGEHQPLGFVDGARHLVLFNPAEARIVAVDTQAGKTVYSTDIAPAGGLASPKEKQALRDRILLYGTLSADNAHFGWIWLDQLHVLETATGAVRVIPLPVQDNRRVDFSRDGRFVLTRKEGDSRTGSVVDLSTGTGKPLEIGGYNVLHFSEAGGLLVNMPGHSATPLGTTTLDHWNVTYLLREWGRELPGMAFPAMTDDGQRLYVWNLKTQQIESVATSGLLPNTSPIFEQLPMDLPRGALYAVTHVPQGRLLLVVQSPRMAFAQLDAAGRVVKSTVVDFSVFNPKVEVARVGVFR